MKVAIGVMAYNEEENIGNTLNALSKQQLDTVDITSITVMASGCTDNTAGVVREEMQHDQRIKLVEESTRGGKTSAINHFLGLVDEEIYVILGGDLIPHKDAIEQLVKQMHNPDVGMTGARPVPLNDSDTFVGYCVHTMWYLHHLVALVQPKMGEMIAVRRELGKLPSTAYADEESYAAIALEAGYDVCYVPEAIVFNKGPESLADFVTQRRRIHCHHLQLARDSGHTAPTMRVQMIARKLLTELKKKPRFAFWMGMMVGLEAYSRLLGTLDFYRGDEDTHKVWTRVSSSKRMNVQKIIEFERPEFAEVLTRDENVS